MSHAGEPDRDAPSPSMGEDFMALVGALVREHHELSSDPVPGTAVMRRARKWPLRAERHGNPDERAERDAPALTRRQPPHEPA